MSRTPLSRILRRLLPLACLCACAVGAYPRQDETVAPPADTAAGPADAIAGLEPFVASYDAWYRGRQAGDATLRLDQAGDARWRIDLSLNGRRGLAGLARLDIQQSTVFEDAPGGYRPLSQSTVRKALLVDKRVTGTYDWQTMQARWDGDLKKDRRRPVELEPGDMSALLINLAVIRDARAGATLRYRFVDGGRVREHVYRVEERPQTLAVGDMHYDALQVARTDDDGDQTLLWVASGVPTPIRILQRKDGRDEIDLKLMEYRGVRG